MPGWTSSPTPETPDSPLEERRNFRLGGAQTAVSNVIVNCSGRHPRDWVVLCCVRICAARAWARCVRRPTRKMSSDGMGELQPELAEAPLVRFHHLAGLSGKLAG